jgi:hypothetical protein
VEINAFHVSALNVGEWVASSSGCFIFGKRDVCLAASLKVVMNCWNQTLPLQFTVTELAVRTGGVSLISESGATINTAVVVVRCNGR